MVNMEALVLANGDITIINGAWIILRYRKAEDKTTRIASDMPYGWWDEAIKCLESTKARIEE